MTALFLGLQRHLSLAPSPWLTLDSDAVLTLCLPASHLAKDTLTVLPDNNQPARTTLSSNQRAQHRLFALQRARAPCTDSTSTNITSLLH